MSQATPAWFTHFSLGSWDPVDCLVSVIDDPAEALQAVDDLRAAGFVEDDVRLFLGQEVVDHDRDIMNHRSSLKNVVYMLSNISDETVMAQEYLDEARQGHQILAVHASDVGRVKQASASVVRHHAHRVRYYGRWTVSDLGGGEG